MPPVPEPVADFMDRLLPVKLLWPAADAASYFACSDGARLVNLAIGAILHHYLAAN